MCEIQFRAWDKNDKEMISEGSSIQVRGDGTFEVYREGHEYYDASIDDIIPQSWTSKGIILMQFTGLLDKNGKEIWEGDIFENQSGRGIIEWWPEHCCFGARKILTGEGVETNEMCIITSDGVTFATEVAGNIYENPVVSLGWRR